MRTATHWGAESEPFKAVRHPDTLRQSAVLPSQIEGDRHQQQSVGNGSTKGTVSLDSGLVDPLVVVRRFGKSVYLFLCYFEPVGKAPPSDNVDVDFITQEGGVCWSRHHS